MLHILLNSAPPSIPVYVTLFERGSLSLSWVWALSWWKGCMKLWDMQCRANQDEWVIVKSFHRMWPTGAGNGNPLQILAWRTPWTVWKGKKIWTLVGELPRLESVQYATGNEHKAITNSSCGNKMTGLKQNWCLVVDISGCESKTQCCKEQYCIGTWNVRSMNQGKLDMVKQEIVVFSLSALWWRRIRGLWKFMLKTQLYLLFI